MKYFSLVFFIFWYFFSTFIQAQTEPVKLNRLESSSFIKTGAFILPSALIVSGTYLGYAKGGRLKQDFQKWIREGHSGFQTDADDYFQWVPTGELVIAGLSGATSRHNSFDRGKYYIISILATSLVTMGLKEFTAEARPDGGTHSFPSGHTSNAFAGATVLYFEYRDTKPLLAWSGYIFASATGVLRIYNNAHWVSDVLAGAGIGIIVPQIIYRTEPLKNRHLFNRKNERTILSLIPVTGRYTGIYVNLRF